MLKIFFFIFFLVTSHVRQVNSLQQITLWPISDEE